MTRGTRDAASSTQNTAPAAPHAELDPSFSPEVGRWVLIATILASSMVFIDGSVVNVALPTLQADLNASAAAVQWVVEAYALFLAALILVGGAVGDRYGRRRVFILGTALFAATSLWCGVATNVQMLIIARAAQGIAGALLTPASLAIISATFTEPTARGRAVGTWSGFTAITTAAGPVLGGFLVDTASWRWVFFINLPVAAVVLLVSRRWMPESRDPQHGRLDWPGAALATVGLGALVFGLIEAPRLGWTAPITWGSLLLGSVALVAFVVVEWRSPAPMLPLGLFRSRTFTGVNLLTFFVYGAFGGAFFWLPFNLIQVQGYSSLQAGATLLPASLILFALSRYTGALVGVTGPRLPLVSGALLVALSLALLARPGVGASYWTSFFPSVMVLGLGLVLTVPALTTTVLNAVETRRAGVASGVNNAVARTAQLLAIAIFGITMLGVFSGTLRDELDAIPNLGAEERSQILVHENDLAAITLPHTLDESTTVAARDAINIAFIDGFRVAMLTGAILSLVGAGAAALLIVNPPRDTQSPCPIAVERIYHREETTHA